MRESGDMCIDNDTRFDVERISQNNVRGLSGNTRQLQQFIHRLWDASFVII